MIDTLEVLTPLPEAEYPIRQRALLVAIDDLTDGLPGAWADEAAAFSRAAKLGGFAVGWKTVDAMVALDLIQRGRVSWTTPALKRGQVPWRGTVLRLTAVGHIECFAQRPSLTPEPIP